MSEDVVIKAEGLWKRYGLPPAESLIHRVGRYGRALLSGSQSSANKPNWKKDDGGIWSLRDVNFELKRGEALGVIGRNGSGKSTLLKILALTSPPTYGNVFIKGRVFSMIELAAGMNMELTGRENVRLLSTIMGFSPRWMVRKMPEIEDFCELAEWFDRPVWQYSSGMMARLGFAVAVNVDADVLLIDEVLSVGDLTFQSKSMSRMDQILKSDATIVLVSHSLAQIWRICSQAILLDKGSVVIQGSVPEVCDVYYKESANEVIEKKKKDQGGIINESSGEIYIKDIILQNEKGDYVDEIRQSEKKKIRLRIQVVKEIPVDLRLIIRIKTVDSVVIADATNTLIQGMLVPGDYYIDFIPDFLPLSPGVYSLASLITQDLYRMAYVENILFFTVLTDTKQHVLTRGGAFFQMAGNLEIHSIEG